MLQHITALRGIAIILVILFHFAPRYFPHGYFGVEIFLVISGYLLMRSRQRQQGQFQLAGFAQKKIMRLFFPVTAALLLTLTAGLFILDYTDYNTTCGTAVATLLAHANSYLQRKAADYFAPDASFNPLLHMWYLTVTVHIYLLFAAACLIRRRIPKRVMTCLLWMVGITSFLWAYSYPIHHWLQTAGLPVWPQTSPASHYATLPRLWEALAGVWLAGLPPVCSAKKIRNSLLLLLGLCCILIPSLLREPHLYIYPLCVVIGTCLVIRYASADRLSTWLNNRLLLLVGTISFSLYLVHMPLFAFWHSWFLCAPDAAGVLILLTASFAISYPFWYFIEKRAASWKLFTALFIATMLMAVAGKKTDGFKHYLNRELNERTVPVIHHSAEANTPGIYDQFDKEALPYFDYIFHYTCKEDFSGSDTPHLVHMGVPGKEPSVVLMGDSHANPVFVGMDMALRELDMSGVCLTSIILPLWNWEQPDPWGGTTYFCGRRKIEALLNWLRAHPGITHVVITQSWESRFGAGSGLDWNLQPQPRSPENFRESLRTFIVNMRQLGKKVILLEPLPTFTHKDMGKVVRLATRRQLFTAEDQPPPGMSYSRARYQEEHALVCSVFDALENDGTCSVLHMESYIPEDSPLNAYNGGNLLYMDDVHMSAEGAKRLFRHLMPQLERALRTPAETMGEGTTTQN